MNEQQLLEMKEVFDRWNNELDAIRELRDKSNALIGERQIMLSNQRSELFKTLITLSIGFLAVPYFLQNIKNWDYYFIAVTIFIVLVVFIILYLRESIDADSFALQKLQDEYSEIAEAKQNLIIEYQQKKVFTYDEYGKFGITLSNLPVIKNLRERVQKELIERTNRGDQVLDYSGILIMFLFLSGILWILFSIVPHYFNWIFIVSLEIITMIFVSNNSIKMISRSHSLVQHFIRKNIK